MPGKNQREQLRLDRERAKLDKERARRNQLYLDWLDAVEKGEKRNFEQYKKHQNYIADRDAKRAKAREEEEKITKQRIAQAKIGAKTANLTAKVNKLLKSGAGEILKQSNLSGTLEKSLEGAKNSTGDLQKGYNLITEAQLTGIQAIKDGTINAQQFMADLEEQFEGMSEEAQKAFGPKMRKQLEAFAEAAEKGGGGLKDALNIDAKDLDGLEGAREKLKQLSAIASSPTLMGAAAIGLTVKFMKDFASAALDVRKELGTGAADSAMLAANIKSASFYATLLGGEGDKAATAITSLTREFGSLDAVTPRVSAGVAEITAQFGIGGENLAKLTKQMSTLNGQSIETNINTLKTVGNLAKAARVAPADVLNDMAESTETFAKFADKGGENLAKAAIEARKLGLELKDVDAIAESLLDFEASIEKQMEASVLIGRQLNLERARELSLAGDLEGVLAEVKNQVGGAEQLSKMNVVQRKALADAVGLEVSQLTKLAAGQKALNAESEGSAAAMLKFALAGAAAGALIGLIGGTLVSIIPGIVASTGIGTAIAGAMQKQGLKTLGKGAAYGGVVGALAGGVVGASTTNVKGALPSGTTKLAEGGVLVGEAGVEAVLPLPSTGIKTDMTESNRLLRQLISQNEILMNRLTNKVGELALSS